MKRDQFDRPVCLGWGPTKPCGTAVHPGYSRCYRCDRLYTSEQLKAALDHPQNASFKKLAAEQEASQMTMPHLMNCSHSGDGWCLECVAALEKERNTFSKAYSYVDSVLNQVKEQRDRLIRALEPFAHQAKIIDGNDASEGVQRAETFELFRFRGSYTAICIGDCRRADEAIHAAKEGVK